VTSDASGPAGILSMVIIFSYCFVKVFKYGSTEKVYEVIWEKGESHIYYMKILYNELNYDFSLNNRINRIQSIILERESNYNRVFNILLHLFSFKTPILQSKKTQKNTRKKHIFNSICRMFSMGF
jgi:hypothetical protein